MPSIRRGEVWWIAFDRSLGGEIRKTRPAVVISNDIANAVLNRVVVVPLSSQVAKIYPSEARVVIEGKPAKAMADQIATASKERFRGRLGRLSAGDLRAVESAVLLHLGLLNGPVTRG
jgi:mRNA interferase MazF